MPETTSYIYTGNVDPTNTSTAFTFNGQTVALGDVVELTDEEYAQLGTLFVLDDGNEPEPDFDENVTSDDSLPILGHSHAPSSPATSDPRGNLGESQNASGSS